MPPSAPTDPVQVAGVVLFFCLVLLAALVFTYDLLHQEELNAYKKKLSDCEGRLLRTKDGKE